MDRIIVICIYWKINLETLKREFYTAKLFFDLQRLCYFLFGFALKLRFVSKRINKDAM